MMGITQSKSSTVTSKTTGGPSDHLSTNRGTSYRIPQTYKHANPSTGNELGNSHINATINANELPDGISDKPKTGRPIKDQNIQQSGASTTPKRCPILAAIHRTPYVQVRLNNRVAVRAFIDGNAKNHVAHSKLGQYIITENALPNSKTPEHLAQITIEEDSPFPPTKLKIKLQMIHNLGEDLILGSDFIKHMQLILSKTGTSSHHNPTDDVILHRAEHRVTDPKSHNTNIYNIPNEVVFKILSYLNPQELCTLGKTNSIMRDLTQQPLLWKRITIAAKNLTQFNVDSFIAKGIKHLDIPYCSITQGESDETYSKARTLEQLRMNFPIQYKTDLSYLGLQGFRGEDILAATLIAKSPDLDTLDLSESRYALMTTIIEQMTANNKISAINLSSIRPHRTPEPGEFYTNTLRLDTVQILIEKCRNLTSLMLAGTKMSRAAISHICTHINPNLEEINMANENMTNTHLDELSSRCNRIKYLNISGTEVRWGNMMTCIPKWNSTMVDLNLPGYIEYVLHISPRHQNQILRTEFIYIIESMINLKSLSINQYKTCNPDYRKRSQNTHRLQNIFPKLIINYDPFTNKGPASLDPSIKFKTRSTPYRRPQKDPKFFMDDVNTLT